MFEFHMPKPIASVCYDKAVIAPSIHAVLTNELVGEYVRTFADVYANDVVCIFEQHCHVEGDDYLTFVILPDDEPILVEKLSVLDFAIKYPILWDLYQVKLGNNPFKEELPF